jgi:hypothetical protein
MTKATAAVKIPSMNLKSFGPYRTAIEKLTALKAELQPLSAQINRVDLQLNRANAAVRQLASRDLPPLPNLDGGELATVIQKVIDAGGVPSELLRSLRSRMNPIPVGDEWDRQMLDDRDSARAKVELVKLAIEQQTTVARKQKDAALSTVALEMRPARLAITERLSAALVQLSEAIAEERELEERLAQIDADLLRLHPRLFPHLLENRELYDWLGQAIEAGMIGAEVRNTLASAITSTTQAREAVPA